MPTLAQTFIPELEMEAAATRRLLERVPADQLDYRPAEQSMTLGQLALHVARIPADLSHMAQLDGIDATTVSFEPPSPASAAELLPTLEASLETAKAYLSQITDEEANAPWRLTAGDREVFALPRGALLRSFLFNHWYHHRGQLTVYLRLVGVPVPAVYGRSADENPFSA